ncbi:lipopolysaccharide biosynthesis protein [Leuconostoc mesenteroides]|uniref:lipopolysaccharide biosynthesis protein n=1 Tax=Leuconostoc mesenteroides TaxID=1245 RepID=UPI000E095C6B|nr:lipopolysaccharide biosynthesis protein [Leuconostoc mesenteroides]
MDNSRTKSAKINSITASSVQFLSLITQFIARTIFIFTLGESYLGLNGLLTNILNILSFSELGIGAAFTFLLYEPLAHHDENKISALVRLYGIIYRRIALIIMSLGLILMPFLPYLIYGKTNVVGNIYLAFFLFLLNTVFSYLWNYKRSIFLADQAGYLNSLNTFAFQFGAQITQIILLLNWPNYYIYLVIQILFTIASNFQISKMIDRKYPFLKNKIVHKVGPATRSYLKKNVIGMMSSKLGGVIIFSTDNLLISAFLGLVSVGKYSNYTLILSGITNVVGQGVGAVTASIGHLNVTAGKERQNSIFYKYSYLSGIIGLAVSIGLITYFDPFITLWLGSKYVLSPLLTWLIVVSFFITQLRQANINFTNAYGLYWEQRYKPIFEAAINLIISIVLLKLTNLGISSVIIGTIISNLVINSWWEPMILLKYGLKNNIVEYAKFYLTQLVSGVMLITMAQYIVRTLSMASDIVKSTALTTLIIIIATMIFECLVIFYGYPKSAGKISVVGIVVHILQGRKTKEKYE